MSEEWEGNAQISFSDNNLGCGVGMSASGENRQSSHFFSYKQRVVLFQE